jgi:hypothetical protein
VLPISVATVIKYIPSFKKDKSLEELAEDDVNVSITCPFNAVIVIIALEIVVGNSIVTIPLLGFGRIENSTALIVEIPEKSGVKHSDVSEHAPSETITAYDPLTVAMNV